MNHIMAVDIYPLCQFQKLTDKHIKDVDNILANLKKVVGAK